MQKYTEGNPDLIEEQPVVLSKGVLVYHKDSTNPAIDFVLSGLPHLGHRCLFGLEDDYEASWNHIESALDETVRMDCYPRGMPDTCNLIREIRGHIEMNALYEEIRKPGQQVRLCLRNSAAYSMVTQEVAPGIVVKFHRPKWHIEIIQDAALVYPKPEKAEG